MEFIRKLFSRGNKKEEEPTRGVAPLQSQEEQDATRARMEAEMDTQREQREARKPQE